MTDLVEVTVLAPLEWASRPGQLAALLNSETNAGGVIPDPTGKPADPENMAVVTSPKGWANDPAALDEALCSAHADAAARSPSTTSGAVSPVEDRLVYTVEEAAALLGISRSFAYESVQRGEVPSMRIGRRILVPKAALQRFLDTVPTTDDDQPS
jgi:excisionase family DNA binding protein